MIIELLIFLITTLLGYYVYSYKSIHNHFKSKGVKYIPGVPIFGNLLGSTFVRKHFLEEIDEAYKAFPDEKYVGFIELTLPVILIRDPELIRKITIKDFEHFTDHREFFSEESDPLFSSSLLFMKGEKWRNMRTTLTPAFTAAKMKFMLPFIQENCNHIIEHLKGHENQTLDVDNLMRRYTNDVIASAGFGITINSLVDKDNEFYKLGNAIFEFTFRQRILSLLQTQFPEFTKKLGIRLFPDRMYTFFYSTVSSTLEQRKKEGVERPDMLQLLMETQGNWTPDEIISQVFIFFAAGYETVATTLVMAIHELTINPDVQEKLYQDIRKYEEARQGKDLTFDNIGELKQLDCVINETLRKWSPAVFLDRTCIKKYELPPPREGGKPYILKPGDIIYNMVNCLQMDEKHFPEPEKFDPDRFSEENKQNIKPFTFLPFGSGPRLCIGMRFAMMELKVLLYHLVLNFKILKCEKTTDPIKLRPQTFKISAMGGSYAKFEKRI